ncbi:uncharacterized protein OCT59_012762 [Rhizophagus irregularis]|uniref:F-box domain-containing protein n=2 Tax=Rhizophagus irregularis (strain DAOM 197198w) TaxID=1432141 RepID=A0A015LY13_RHIIW|nr:hypothetical protein RirG_022510 [Rhizophagus irregularis DAOM 197198w]UZO20336.1 hypothetical protein OCT59_012762 [Rhizophagus irregularis]
MSKLNKDILFLIFEELQDDSESLFSCLMVNRLWCETVIPILWRNPWCYDIDYRNKDYLFIIIASYLSDETKKILTRQGFRLQLVSYQSFLFDYLSFCRSINVKIIESIFTIKIYSYYHRISLQEEFYEHIIKKCPKFKYLDMKQIKIRIFSFPEARLRFESLSELECESSTDQSYFYSLADISQHIQRLIIINYSDTVKFGIAKLIEVQKNLKHFEFIDHYYCFNFFIMDSYKEIILALEKKADSINHLRIYFENHDFTLQKVLPKFHKLKTLTIHCKEFNVEQLKSGVYNDLEIFNIDYYNMNAAFIIIENNGRNLKKISIDFISYINVRIRIPCENFKYNTLILIRKIHENCPLIEYLSLIFSPSEQNFSEFEKLLKVCQNLKSLLLIIYTLETNEMILGKQVLNTLIKSAPTKLREIRFLNHIRFSSEALEEFLGNWKGLALSIITSDSLYNIKEYKKLIDKYKNDGVIEDFRCNRTMDLLI